MRQRFALTSIFSLLLCATASANNFSVSGPGGAIPDCPSSPGAWNLAPGWGVFTSTVTVLNPVTSITAVRLSGLSHPNRGDLHVFLSDPNGVRHNVVVRPGWNGTTGGDSGNYNAGTYTFVQSGGGNISQGGVDIAPGTYNQFLNSGGGMWTSASYVINNTPLNSITGPAGTWTLTVVDWWNLNVDSLLPWVLEGTDTADPGMMYWASNTTSTIHRANLDGTSEQDLLLPISTPITGTIALDLQGGKLYWARPSTQTIHRANLDGTSDQDLLLNIHAINNGNIQLDVAGGKLYWASNGTNTVHRANLDGTVEEDLLLPIDGSNNKTIRLDSQGGKLYWASNATGTIHRANLDGTSDQDLLLALSTLSGLSLDTQGGKIYWAQGIHIHRANLDGTSNQDLLLSVNNLNGNTALDVQGGKLYYASNPTSTIHRANLDGTSDQNLLLSIDEDDNGKIWLDLQRGKMYWASDVTNTIHRANLDGTGDQDLLRSIDSGNGNIYLALPESPMVQGCLPSQAGIQNCPCSNPPAGGGLGCDNFGAGPAKSGTLDAIGVASLASDTVVLVASGENNTSLSVFWSGQTAVAPPGAVSGAGLRCVSTNLKRLWIAPAAGGANARPGLGDETVSARTSSAGAPITAGQTRYYYVAYRDPQAAGPCGSSSSTINTTNAGSIDWGF